MLLLTVFNEALSKVPNIANAMKRRVKAQKWDEERIEHAVEIIEGLDKTELADEVDDYLPEENYPNIRFKPLYLELNTSDLNKISKERNINEIMQYVEKLINDINQFSYEIILQYGGDDYDEERDLFGAQIDWYI